MGGLLAGAAIGVGTKLIDNMINAGQAENMQEMNIRGQKEMANFNRGQQMLMWNDTGYGAQIKQMQEAGLNPGLMYKGAGGGGQTNATPGNVPGQNQQSGSVGEGIKTGMMNELQNAQIENLKADTVKKTTEAQEITERTPTYAKGMELTDSQIQEIASKMGVNEAEIKSKLQGIKVGEAEVKVKEAQVPQIEAETKKIETITPIERDILKEELKGQVTRNLYLGHKEKAELENLLQDVVNKKTQLEQTGQKLDIETFTAEMKADYPGLFDVAGRAIDGIIRGMQRLTKGTDEGLIRKIEKR